MVQEVVFLWVFGFWQMEAESVTASASQREAEGVGGQHDVVLAALVVVAEVSLWGNREKGGQGSFTEGIERREVMGHSLRK